jgi:hypothetical protein
MDKGSPLSKGSPLDYGTILVHFLPGLTYDQKYTIVKQNLENQVFTKNRMHYNQMLEQCTEMMKIIENSFTINWNLPGYKYTFRIEYLDD